MPLGSSLTNNGPNINHARNSRVTYVILLCNFTKTPGLFSSAHVILPTSISVKTFQELSQQLQKRLDAETSRIRERFVSSRVRPNLDQRDLPFVPPIPWRQPTDLGDVYLVPSLDWASAMSP